MELIKLYLERFSGLKLPDDTLKRLLLDILNNDLNIKLERDCLSVKNGEIIIKASPVVKSEIFINKNKILTKLEKSFGLKTPSNIR